jgi:hypothetical protein
MSTSVSTRIRTKLNRQQIVGFWAAWFGWTLDGMDSVIYALVLAPALTELLPRSGIAATPANIGFYGSVMFALFLIGWGMSFIWGLCGVHRCGRAFALGLYAGLVPIPRRGGDWRRMGDGGHLYRGILA